MMKSKIMQFAEKYGLLKIGGVVVACLVLSTFRHVPEAAQTFASLASTTV